VKPVLRVGLAQISEQRFQHFYFPYSVGLLQAYAQRWAPDPARYEFTLPLYSRLSVQKGVQYLLESDIAGFSCYIWNINRSLAIAQSLKLQNPHVLIMMGGPQIPNLSEAFLRKYPFVDVCVHGEGEQSFLKLLESWPENHWSDIPGISWLDAAGQYHQNPQGPRIRDLDIIPSPYLSGIFDRLIEAWPGREWIGTWETNRGCPFSCSFCDWGSLTQSKVYRFDMERLKAEIEWFGSRKVADIFTADANFGIFSRDVELANHFAATRKQYGFPRVLQTQTAKNVKERNLEIQKILVDAGLNAVTSLAVQSTNPEVLKAIRRENISLQTYRDIQKFCLDHGIYSYTDIILGLPGESYDSFAQTIDDVLTHGQYNKLIFYNASLLPNAEMAQAEYRERYGIESIQIHFPGHGQPEDGIYEYLEIVVATHSLSRSDWIRMHVLAWMTNFLVYTHKMLQLPLLALHVKSELPWREMIEAFTNPQALSEFPLLGAILNSMVFTAQKLQAGYVHQNENPLLYSWDDGAHLAPDIALQVRLHQEGKTELFFRESRDLLWNLLETKKIDYPRDLLDESIGLSRSLFCELFYRQFFNGTIPAEIPRFETLPLSYNLREFFHSRLDGGNLALEKIDKTI